MHMFKDTFIGIFFAALFVKTKTKQTKKTLQLKQKQKNKKGAAAAGGLRGGEFCRFWFPVTPAS